MVSGWLVACVVLLSTLFVSANDNIDVAYKKKVYMSSTGYGGKPEFTVDGDDSTNSHTRFNTKYSIVIIDLMDRYVIKRLEIKERPSGPHGHFDVFVGDFYQPRDESFSFLKTYSPCSSQDGVKDYYAVLKLNCVIGAQGRYVAIRRRKASDALILQTVKVFGDMQHGGGYMSFSGGKNWALTGRPAYAMDSSSIYEKQMVVDDKLNTCAYLDKRFEVVVDFNATVDRPFVKVFNKEGRIFGFDILIGHRWLPCHKERLKKFSLCGSVFPHGPNTGFCNGAGRFVAIRRHKSGDLCEVSAFGPQLPPALDVPYKDYEVSCKVKKNLALHKPAYQVSDSYGAVASRAVDGNSDGSFGHGRCTHTRGGKEDWFVVDLQAGYDIEDVKIWPRTEWFFNGESYYSQLEVSIGTVYSPCKASLRNAFTPCSKKPKFTKGEPLWTHCKGRGQYVMIRNMHPLNRPLILCEVEVFGVKISGPTNLGYKQSCSVSKDNAAYNKPTWQSSVGWNAKSSRAVDGNNDPNFGNNHCSSTHGNKGEWWIVDLKGVYNIEDVKIWPRRTHDRAYYTDLEVSIGETFSECMQGLRNEFKACATKPKYTDGEPLLTGCRGKGRFVMVKTLTAKHLYLCEVEVFGKKVSDVTEGQDIYACDVNKNNLAINKPTFQSSTNYGGVSKLVVDGAKSGKCGHTAGRVGEWFVVDLQSHYAVSNVKIWPRTEYWISFEQNYGNIEVLIGDKFLSCEPSLLKNFKKCFNSTPKKQKAEPIVTGCFGQGRYVMVRQRDARALQLCEVEVYGRKLDKQPPTSGGNVWEKSCEVVKDHVAFNKPTFQNGHPYNAVASRAVDGNGNMAFSQNSCTHTNGDGWWYVDLKGHYDIQQIRIWPRHPSYPQEYDNIRVLLSEKHSECNKEQKMKECYSSVGKFKPGSPMVTNCVGMARYVRIEQKMPGKSLILCEVEVFGEKKKDIDSKTDWLDACKPLKKESAAFEKKAYMINNRYKEYPDIVDGLTNRKVGTPHLKQQKPWIIIDLNSTVDVKLVRVFDASGTGVTSGFDIYVGWIWQHCMDYFMSSSFVRCGSVERKPGAIMDVACTHRDVRYVSVRGRGNGSLSLSEVEVFSYEKPRPLPPADLPKWLSTCDFISDKNINIALGKKVLHKKDNKSPINDGIADTNDCPYIRHNEFFTIDLGEVYDVTAVRVWDRKNFFSLGDAQIRVISVYNPCMEGWRHGELCDVIDGQNLNQPATVRCAARGRYISISKRTNNNKPLLVCEVEAFGKVLKGIQELQPRKLPRLTGTLPLTQIIRDDFLAGIDGVTVGAYASPMIPVAPNTEAIIVDPKTAMSTMAVSKWGKGRVLASGDTADKNQLCTTKRALFWPKVATWLGYGKEVKCVDAKDVTADAGEGTVIVWNPYNIISDTQISTIRNLVKGGKAGLLFACKTWSFGKRLHSSKAIKLLLNEIGIFTNLHYFNPEVWSQKAVAKEMTMPETWRLSYMTVNTDAFFKYHSLLKRDYPGAVYNAMKFSEHALKLVRQYDLYIQDVAPCLFRPLTDPLAKKAVSAYSSLMLSQGLVGSGQAVLVARIFPGVPTSLYAPPLERAIEFRGDIQEEYHSTGLYLMPGATLEFEAMDAASRDQLPKWSVRVGPHVDNISERPAWIRFTEIATEVTAERGRIYSGFGGTIWVRNAHAKARLRLRLKGAIEAPFLNLRDPQSVSKWQTNRNAPAPFAEIAGDAIIFSLQSKFVRHLSADYLKKMMKFWDDIVKEDHHLRGTSWKARRRFRTSADLQIRVGAAHSGYPIVSTLAWQEAFVDLEASKKSAHWGMLHEIGHNFQLKEWTPTGTGEVTVNIFVLYNRFLRGLETGFNFDRFPKADIAKHLSIPNRNIFNSKFFVFLSFYANLAEQFSFAFYKGVFRYYIEHKLKPADDDARRQTFYFVTSTVSGYDLSPMFEFWGWEVKAETKAKLQGKNLKPFLPNDSFTKLMQNDQVQAILSRHPGAVRSATKVTDRWAGEMANFSDKLANDVIFL